MQQPLNHPCNPSLGSSKSLFPMDWDPSTEFVVLGRGKGSPTSLRGLATPAHPQPRAAALCSWLMVSQSPPGTFQEVVPQGFFQQ